MKIDLQRIKVRDVVAGYIDSNEDGVVGYGGKLDIRPKYQREFVYKEKQRDEVIRSVTRDFPLNVMYWAREDAGRFGLLDGQQRTISIARYVSNDFSIDGMFFGNLSDEKQNQILDYELMVYWCEGTPDEVLDWFKIINIAGEVLSDQELRNASYTGSWLSAAKLIFSKTDCVAYGLAEKYVDGSPIRQQFLETAIKWMGDDSDLGIRNYMGKHQHDTNADELWGHFQEVIHWVEATFPNYRKEMKGLEWGKLYAEFGSAKLDADELEKQIKALMIDEDVTNKRGIYAYVLTGDDKYLNIRTFTDKMKREAYERQEGICAKCGKHFELTEMEVDHITPWSKGGATSAENCQMLCLGCNRQKSDK
jgi:hypothetical protein